VAVLLGTKLRTKLLTYSFTHPGETYYVRELASLIEEDPGNLSRELQKLADDGLYTAEVRGRIKLYTLNKKHHLFNELKKIVFKTGGAGGSLKKLVAGFKDISLAFIYGSYASGKENQASDIDLVVVGNLPRDRFTRTIRALESKLNREINFTSYLEKEFARERRKNGSFLNLVLKNKIILLKGVLDAE
jgi:predicted nucleotidyltransferase